jgi:hypothetical protein
MKTMFVSLKRGLGAAIFGIVIASTAQAQVFTPTYQSPRLVNELGVYLHDGPGDLGVEGIWRAGPLGLRVGYVDLLDGYLSVGGELRNPIAVAGAPLGLAFTAAAQGLIGDESGVGIGAGLSAGYTFTGEGLAITPYIHPRIGLINPVDSDDFSVELLADVGADVELTNNLLIKLGVRLDDNLGSNWGIGLGWRR